MEETDKAELRRRLDAFLRTAVPLHQQQLLAAFDSGEIAGRTIAEVSSFREFEDLLPSAWHTLTKPKRELMKGSDYLLRVARFGVYTALRFLATPDDSRDGDVTEQWLLQLDDQVQDTASSSGSSEEDEPPSSEGKRKRKGRKLKSARPVQDTLVNHPQETILFARLVAAVCRSVVPKDDRGITTDGSRMLCGQFLDYSAGCDERGCFKRFPRTTEGGGGSELVRAARTIYLVLTGTNSTARPARSAGAKRTHRPAQMQLLRHTALPKMLQQQQQQQQLSGVPFEFNPYPVSGLPPIFHGFGHATSTVQQWPIVTNTYETPGFSDDLTDEDISTLRELLGDDNDDGSTSGDSTSSVSSAPGVDEFTEFGAVVEDTSFLDDLEDFDDFFNCLDKDGDNHPAKRGRIVADDVASGLGPQATSVITL